MAFDFCDYIASYSKDDYKIEFVLKETVVL